MTHYPKILWHFTDGALRDGRPLPPVGEWLISKGKIIPCKRGLHASPTPWDASRYAPGSVLHQVKLGGTVLPHGDPIDKYAASKRALGPRAWNSALSATQLPPKAKAQSRDDSGPSRLQILRGCSQRGCSGQAESRSVGRPPRILV